MSVRAEGPEVEAWESEVGLLLYETSFDSDASYDDKHARAQRWSSCGRFVTRSKCNDCGNEWGSFRHVCNIRGHSRCREGLRRRLMARYMPRLEDYPEGQLRHVTFTYARVPGEDLEQETGWLLGRVGFFVRIMFAGGVVSAEFTAKLPDGKFYAHVHALVVGRPGERFDYTVLNAGWRQLAQSELHVEKVKHARKSLRYVLGYALKQYGPVDKEIHNKAGRCVDKVIGISPAMFVKMVSSVERKRLVRAFGCVYGGRKGTVGKPKVGGRASGDSAEERDASLSRSLENDSIKLSLYVCPVCHSENVERSTVAIVESIERSGDVRSDRERSDRDVEVFEYLSRSFEGIGPGLVW